MRQVDYCDVCERPIFEGQQHWFIKGIVYCRICYIARFGVPEGEKE